MPEPDTMHPRNRPYLRSTITFLFLLVFGGALLAQQPAAPPLPAEQQPPLNVDRDPVPVRDPAAEGPAAAASPTQPGQVAKGKNGGYTLTRDVDEVVLNATVIDDHGHLVTGLSKDDFHVFEDGKPQTMTALQEQDIPVSIGLLIDNSGSMRTMSSAAWFTAFGLVRMV